jgi:uncharacterized protein (TIGR03067 family)
MGLANQQAMVLFDPFTNWFQRPTLLTDKDEYVGNIVAVSPDGKLLAAGHKDGTIHVWDLGFTRPALPGGPRQPGIDGIIIPDRKEEAARKDREMLQGTWERVAFVRGATRLAGDPEDTITFEDEQFGQKSVGEMNQADRFEIIDATTEPKQIDFFCSSLRLRGLRYRAIYKIEGDRLEICTAQGTGARPKEFSGDAGSCRIMKRKER